MRSDSYSEYIKYKSDVERFISEFWIQNEIDRRALNSRSEKVSNVNIVRNVVRLLTGHQRATRKQLVLQNDSSDEQLQKSVDFYGFALEKLLLGAQAYETISTAFEENVSYGLSAISIAGTYDNFCALPFLSSNLIFDENFFDTGDFNSCDFVGSRSRVSRSETAVNYPEQIEEIANSTPVSFNESSFYPRHSFIQDDFYRWKMSPYVQIISSEQTWEVQKNSDYHKSVIRKLILSGIEFREKEIRKKLPWVKKFVNGVEVFDKTYPHLPDCLPIKALYANILNPYSNFNDSRTGDCIQGLVRELRDLQAMMGRVTGSIDSILDSRKISGWAYSQGSVSEDDVNSLERYGNIPLQDKDARLERLTPVEIPQTYTGFLDQLTALSKITGANEELFGVSENETALTAMLRQSAGLITLNKYFDQLDHATKYIGQIALKEMFQFDPFVLSSIVKKPFPTTSITENMIRVEIEEGMNSDLQKRRKFSQLVELFQMGILEDRAIILKNAPLQNLSELQETLVAQQQIQQKKEQEEAKIQTVQLQKENELSLAKTKADITKLHSQSIKDLAQAEKSKKEVTNGT